MRTQSRPRRGKHMPSRRNARENAHPPRRRWRSVRFAPAPATSIVMSTSKTRRSRGKPRVSATPSRRPPQNSSVSVLPDLPHSLAFGRSRVEHRHAALQWATKRHARQKIVKKNTENDKIVNVFIPNRLCVWEGKSPDQQGSFIQCARSGQLSAVSTFECVYGVDISHDDCGHPNLTVVYFRDVFEGGTRLEEIL